MKLVRNNGLKMVKRCGQLQWLVCLVIVVSTCQAAPDTFLKQVKYPTAGDQEALMMNMSSVKEITISLIFDKDLIREKKVQQLEVLFKTSTVSPQFNILSLDAASSRIILSIKTIEAKNYAPDVQLKLHANYIGHAILEPVAIEYKDNTNALAKSQPVPKGTFRMPVTIVQFEGIWGTIFIVSVSILMLISYINLGSQLDMDNMKAIIEKPKTLILGFFISVFVMPLFSWFIGQWLLGRQQLYRVGSFVFACCPAASASTLWTVMLHSDKELSVGLQVVSTFGALATMPGLLYLMDRSLSSEISYHAIRIPYGRLIGTLFTLMVALMAGWWLVGQNERAKKISQRIFRPLVFFVLIFIIVFSSILYWHIYQMFDWNITLATFIITMFTYLISGALGHIINCDLDRGVAIAISSAYKNSGIAFAVLLVAFETPDLYIAYVPCLTQIVLTSLSLYTAYLLVSLITCVRRRGQPGPIQAQAAEEGRGVVVEATTGAKEIADQSSGGRRGTKSGSFGDKSSKSDENNDEFIAMNVTDLDSPVTDSVGAAVASAAAKTSDQLNDTTTTTTTTNKEG